MHLQIGTAFPYPESKQSCPFQPFQHATRQGALCFLSSIPALPQRAGQEGCTLAQRKMEDSHCHPLLCNPSFKQGKFGFGSFFFTSFLGK